MQADTRNTSRIIALVDMDCFYVQVEQRLCPEYLGKPCAVVQYNAWKGGGIIAVNYEARDFGVQRRGMRGNEAQRKCPELHLFRVPTERGKANLTRYREAGAEVMDVMCEFSDCVERASIDEAYLDLTGEVNRRLQEQEGLQVTATSLTNTYVVGFEEKQHLDETEAGVSAVDKREAGLSDWLNSSCSVNECDLKLAIAATIIEEMRAAIFKKTTFKCSAGIAHNKMLAKIACGLHKPNRQTILPQQSVHIFYETLSIGKVRSLGGKLGEEVMEKLCIQTMAELSKVKEGQLHKLFGDKTGSYLYQLGQGIENDPVSSRQLAKSIGCGKNFRGRESLSTKAAVQHWVKELSEELVERLLKDQKENNRVAKHLCVSVQRSASGATSRSVSLHAYDSERIAKDIMQQLIKLNSSAPNSDTWIPSLTNISISAGKFQDNLDVPAAHIKSFFAKKSPSKIIPDEMQTRTKTYCDGDYDDDDDNHDVAEITNLSRVIDSDVSETRKCVSNTMNACNISKVTNPEGFFAKKMLALDSCKKDCEKSKTQITPLNMLCYSSNGDGKLTHKNDYQTHAGDKLKNSKLQRNIYDDVKIGECSVNPPSTSSANCEDVSLQEEEEDEDNEFAYKCEHCRKMIPLQDIEEHTDYHFAQRLQQELQPAKANPAERANPVKSPVKNPKRKGRPKKNVTDKKPKIGMLPLEFYMK